MNLEVKGVHVEITTEIRDYLDKKLQRLDFAKEYIVDLLITVGQEKREYEVEATINFRWGKAIHVRLDGFDILEAIDKLVDKLERQTNEEKKKVQEKKGKDTIRTGEVAP